MINSLLGKLGFSDKEIEIYLAILKNGRITAGTLAKTVDINRTTIYTLVKGLIDKGVISEDLGGPVAHLVAVDPADLFKYINKEQRELDSKRELAEKAVRELSRLSFATGQSIPKIVFVEEKNITHFLFEQDKKWLDSIIRADGIWWGFQDAYFIEKYFKWIKDTWQEKGSDKISTRFLTNESKPENEMRSQQIPQRQTKFWPGETFTSTFWVAGDYLTMVVAKESPNYLVEINDRVLASNFRTVLKQLWKSI